MDVEGRKILVRKAPILPHLGTTGRHRALWSICTDSGSSAKGASGRANVLVGVGVGEQTKEHRLLNEGWFG